MSSSGGELAGTETWSALPDCFRPLAHPATAFPLVKLKVKNQWIPNRLDLCLICGSLGCKSTLLYCHDCGECFHSFCLFPPVQIQDLLSSEPWRCPDCKQCSKCNKVGLEDNSIICDKCDNVFHFSCISNPPKKLLPEEGWRCSTCAVCLWCGTKEPGPTGWTQSSTLCQACFQLYHGSAQCETFAHVLAKLEPVKAEIMKHVPVQTRSKKRLLGDEEFVSETTKKLKTSKKETPMATNQTACVSNLSPKLTPQEMRIGRRESKGLSMVSGRRNPASLPQITIPFKKSLKLSDGRLLDLNLVREFVANHPDQPIKEVLLQYLRQPPATKTHLFEPIGTRQQKRTESEKKQDPFPHETESQTKTDTPSKPELIQTSPEEFVVKTEKPAFRFKPKKMTISLKRKKSRTAWYNIAEFEYTHIRSKEQALQAIKRLEYGPAELQVFQERPFQPSSNQTEIQYDSFLDHRTNDYRNDPRRCILCRGDFFIRGRLLPVDTDSWVHSNCAIWSSEVFEQNETLMNLSPMITKASTQICNYCQEPGASLSCKTSKCPATFHLVCAILANSKFVSPSGNAKRKIHCEFHATQTEKPPKLKTTGKKRGRPRKCPILDLSNLHPVKDEPSAIDDEPQKNPSTQLDQPMDTQSIKVELQSPKVEPQSPKVDPQSPFQNGNSAEHGDPAGSNESFHSGSPGSDPQLTQDGISAPFESTEANIAPAETVQSHLLMDEEVNTNGADVTNATQPTDEPPKLKFSTPLSYFRDHRQLITRAEPQKIKNKIKFKKKGANRAQLRIGQLTIISIGQISPLESFHTRDLVFPVGFKAQRQFYSWTPDTQPPPHPSLPKNRNSVSSAPTNLRRRCLYTLDILQHEDKPLFRIRSEDDPQNIILSYHPDLAYETLIARINSSLGNGSPVLKSRRGEDFFGFSSPHFQEKIEKLPSIRFAKTYEKRYLNTIKIPLNSYLLSRAPRPPLHAVMEPPPNPSGCIRLEPYRKLTSHEKARHLKAFTSNPIASYLLPHKLPLPTAGKKNLMYQSDAQKYQEMKQKNSTGLRLQVLRSQIEGWGVYAKQDIKEGEIIIEYVGELIHTALADLREAFYNAKNIGCYMFGIPYEEEIVDATMRGNMARFINHSCDPNAKTDYMIYAEQKKIVIYAIRDIKPGEEISYDYMFAVDENDMVPCNCGAANCKGFMNIED